MITRALVLLGLWALLLAAPLTLRETMPQDAVDGEMLTCTLTLELADAATGRTFEVGGPDVVSWNELWGRLKRALGVRRPSIHVPMAVMRANAFVTEHLPGDIPLTRDLLKMMEAGDNVVTNDDAMRVFALTLLPLDEQLRRAA